MLTFAEELWHAANTEPVRDTDLVFPPGLSLADMREMARAARTPRRKIPADSAGAKVRVFERDDPAGLLAVLDINRVKDVYASEVWQDIVRVRHDHPSQAAQRARWLAMSDEEKFHYHVKQKAPNGEHAAWWVGFRKGVFDLDVPAYAYLLDRYKQDEVWIQWLVGTKVIGQGVAIRPLLCALYDIGVKRLCWKALPSHRLVGAHWSKLKVTDRPADAWERHHPGHYRMYTYELTQRPEAWEDIARG